METVKNGHFVHVKYTGTLENGAVFDSNRDTHPLEVEVGAGRIIKGFEDALLGMTKAEEKTFTLSPEEAYGPRNESLEQSFMRSELPEGFDPKVGQVLALQNPQGAKFPAKVKRADEEKITVDLNHPLAGETLTFAIKVVEINDSPSPSVCTPSSCSSCGSTCS